MRMKREFVFFGALAVTILIVAAFFLFGRNEGGRDIAPETGRLRVVATFYPLAEFSRMAGGDAVHVTTIVPFGAEPHEYDPTPKDIISIEQADVFVFNGSGMDPWAEKLAPSLRGKGIVVVNASESVTALPLSEGVSDPHFWLDPVFAESIIGSLRVAFSEKDPSRTASFDAAAAQSLSEMEAVDGEYRNTLSHCSKNEVVTSHDAFAYLAKRYAFEAHSISGLSPEAEPSAGRMADLANLAKKENIRYIFFETLVSPKVSKTLAREIGAETLVFDPIEGISKEDAAAGKNYISIMRENLANLSKAMECTP